MTAEQQKPELIESTSIYRGHIFNVSVDKVREGDSIYEREVVHHAGSAVIVPIYEDQSVALVRQYRHPVGEYLLELPAGSLSPSEEPEKAAARELEEELGLVADHLEQLTEFFPSPGFCEEKMWLFLATGLTSTQQHLDDDEQIECVREPFSRALEMISTGEIMDAKSIIGILLAAKRLNVTL